MRALLPLLPALRGGFPSAARALAPRRRVARGRRLGCCHRPGARARRLRILILRHGPRHGWLRIEHHARYGRILGPTCAPRRGRRERQLGDRRMRPRRHRFGVRSCRRWPAPACRAGRLRVCRGSRLRVCGGLATACRDSSLRVCRRLARPGRACRLRTCRRRWLARAHRACRLRACRRLAPACRRRRLRACRRLAPACRRRRLRACRRLAPACRDGRLGAWRRRRLRACRRCRFARYRHRRSASSHHHRLGRACRDRRLTRRRGNGRLASPRHRRSASSHHHHRLVVRSCTGPRRLERGQQASEPVLENGPRQSADVGLKPRGRLGDRLGQRNAMVGAPHGDRIIVKAARVATVVARGCALAEAPRWRRARVRHQGLAPRPCGEHQPASAGAIEDHLGGHRALVDGTARPSVPG